MLRPRPRPLARSRLVTTFILNALAFLATSARGDALTPEDLVRLIEVRDARISPDGRLVAFTAADSLDPTLYQIWTVPADGSDRPRPFTAGGRSARAPLFSPSGTELLFLSARGDTAREQIQIIDMAGGESRQLTGEPGGVLEMAWSPDGRMVAYTTPGSPPVTGDPIDGSLEPAGMRLRIRDVETGETRTISPDTASVWRFAWSPQGNRLAVLFTRPGRPGEWRRGMMALVEPHGSEWRRVSGRVDPYQEPAFSPDGKMLAFYALTGDPGSYPVLHLLDVKSGSSRRISTTEWRGTDEGATWNRAGLFVNAFEGVRCTITQVDPETGARSDVQERWTAPGLAGPSLSSATGSAICYLGDGPDHPADVFVVDPVTGTAHRVTSMNRQLRHFAFARPEPMTWKSFDGLAVEGLLLSPGSAGTGPLPLVVLAHGGPSWNWSLRFLSDPHYPALLFTAGGYRVLLPNPRGSTGYGESFKKLNEGDPGGGDFRDILSGIDSLVAAGLADPERIAIAGFSYGGFLSAWAISNSDRFRCAVVGAGPMDFHSDYTRNELSPWWQEEFLGGDPWSNPALYVERSPLTHVSKVRCPVLILHGAEDRRVPLFHSKALHRSLERGGVPVEFYIYPREGHGLTEPEHLVDVARRQLEWFNRYLR